MLFWTLQRSIFTCRSFSEGFLGPTARVVASSNASTKRFYGTVRLRQILKPFHTPKFSPRSSPAQFASRHQNRRPFQKVFAPLKQKMGVLFFVSSWLQGIRNHLKIFFTPDQTRSRCGFAFCKLIAFENWKPSNTRIAGERTCCSLT